MEIKVSKERITHEVSEQVSKITITPVQLKKIICDALSAEGFTVFPEDVLYKTSYQYASDEWGMNRHLVTCFEGVTATIKEDRPMQH